MITVAEIGSHRLKNVLIKDKNHSPSRLRNILKSEITEILKSYVELDDEIELKLDEERGRLLISIKATAIRVKEFGTILD